MIARVAESCYWLMRYMERCSTTSRLLRVQSGMVLDTVIPASRTWLPLLTVSGERPSFEERYGKRAVSDGDKVVDHLTWDDTTAASIFSSLRYARENARTVRETISLEMWNSINAFWLWMRSRRARNMFKSDREAFFDEVNDRCHLFQGIAQDTMLHEEAFDFMLLGRYLERAGQTARILDLHHHALGGKVSAPTEAVEGAEWIAILRTRYAYEPFFKKRRSSLGGPAVAEFMIQEASFPNSVAHAVTRAQDCLTRIRPANSQIGRRSADALARLRSAVVGLDVERAIDGAIHDVLTHIVDHTAEISRAISEEYFYAVFPEQEVEESSAVTEA